MEISIIGGGFAGLVSGLYLSQLPHADITIYEKQQYNEYKASLCGEIISKRSLEKLTKETIWERNKRNTQNKITSLTLHIGENEAHMKQNAYILNRTYAQREMISLLTAKGVHFQFGKKVTPSDLANIDYDYLIGAGGPLSPVGSFINEKREILPACQYDMRLEGEWNPHTTHLYKLPYLDYYAWVFPLEGDRFHVGAPYTFDLLDKVIEDTNIQGEILSKDAQPLASYPSKLQDREKRAFMVSHFTNPITGGGMVPIIYASSLLYECFMDDEPFTYAERVRQHPINPEKWRKFETYVNPDDFSKVKKLGKLLDGKHIKEKWKTFLRLLPHPFLLNYARHMYNFLRKVEKWSL